MTSRSALFASWLGGRASVNDRARTAWLGGAMTLIARVITIGTSFISISILARTLSREEFGLFAVLTSLVAVTGAMDFGLSNGLRNKLVVLAADPGADDLAKRYCLATFYALAIPAVALAVTLFVVSPAMPWSRIFNIQSSSLQLSATWGLPTVVAIMMLNIPLLVGGAGLYAYQESHWRAVWDGVSGVVAATVVTLVAWSHASVYVVCAAYFGTYAVGATGGLVTFLWRRRWRPTGVSAHQMATCVRDLAGLSASFWLLSMSAAGVTGFGTLVAGHSLGLADAGDFNVVQRIFLLLITCQQAVLLPFWSAFTHAQVTADWDWVRRSLRNLAIGTVVAVAAGGTVLAFFVEPLLHFWVGRSIRMGAVPAMFVGWIVLFSWGSVYGVCLNGLGRVVGQLRRTCLGAVITLGSSYHFASALGAGGIVMAMILGVIPLAILNPWECYRVLDANQSKTGLRKPWA